MIIMFVSNALLYWMKSYLKDVIKIDQTLIDIFFIVVVVTAPISGIIIGGILVNKIGGFQHVNSLKMGVIISFILFSIGIILFFIYNLYAFGSLIWTFLFFGSMLDPCVTGTVIKSLPDNLKGTGYTFNLIYSNIFGTSLGPFIFGLLFDIGKKIELLTLPVGVILSTPIVASLSLLYLILIKKN